LDYKIKIIVNYQTLFEICGAKIDDNFYKIDNNFRLPKAAARRQRKLT